MSIIYPWYADEELDMMPWPDVGLSQPLPGTHWSQNQGGKCVHGNLRYPPTQEIAGPNKALLRETNG